MVKPMLGISVSAQHVRGVLVERGSVAWAGQAEWTSLSELSDAIGRLAGEITRPVRRARVVLERDVAQCRALIPAPPLKNGAVAKYVALEAPRLFRRNGTALLTDATLVKVEGKTRALRAAAASEALVREVLNGCAGAGFTVEAIGPAADVLPRAFARAPEQIALPIPDGRATEILEIGIGGVWRSRLVRKTGSGEQGAEAALVPELDRLGDGAGAFAAAYASAVAHPKLSFFPEEIRHARARTATRRLVKLAIIAAILWSSAGALYVARLGWAARTARAETAALADAVDVALDARRQLALANDALATIDDAVRTRSRHLELLGALARTLDRSSYLVSLTVSARDTVQVVGHASP